MLDPYEVRKDFPILSVRRSDGKPLVYLDNAATSLKPRYVIEAIVEYYERYTVNVHRGVYRLSQEATEMYEDSRERIARFIGVSPSELIFVKNTTEAINLVAYGLDWNPGDEIITTVMEHHSNLVPWQMVRDRYGVKLRFLDITGGGTLDLEKLPDILSERTRLIALTHISNVLGTVNPVDDIARIARKNDILLLVDAAQSVPHIPVDARRIGCDFLAFSGHKMLGPTGIGCLYIRRGVEDQVKPVFTGGEMVRRVSLDRSTWNDMPWRMEPGTPNVAGAIGLAAAVDYLSRLGMDKVRSYEDRLTEYTLRRLSEIEDVTIYGPRDTRFRSGIAAFNVGSIDPHDVALLLDELENIAVRSGVHCAEPLHARLGLTGTVRASLYIYNTMEEIDILCDTLKKIVETLA
ncbi:MAG: cysteine desulfurase [Nitrososphaerota archaeon]|nr:cysteine desulfurase [Candidatus Bathyarchaeota archaeon]MDW8061503.1 cysteine desulfurase [Nitrososphaerota archaeon]